MSIVRALEEETAIHRAQRLEYCHFHQKLLSHRTTSPLHRDIHVAQKTQKGGVAPVTVYDDRIYTLFCTGPVPSDPLFAPANSGLIAAAVRSPQGAIKYP